MSNRDALYSYVESSQAVGALRRPRVAPSSLEDQLWKWLQEHKSDVLTHRESLPMDVVREAVIQGIATLNASPDQRQWLLQRVLNRLLGAGILEPWMQDPAITEIMMTGTKIRIERDGRYETVHKLSSATEAIQLADFLCSRADARYQPTIPYQTLIWPSNGARMNVVHHYYTGNDGPVITIRKRNQTAQLDIQDLIDRGMLNEEMAEWLIQVLRAKANAILAGPTGTGKTTVLRALAQAAIPRFERVITIEDIDELQMTDAFEDCVSLVGSDKADNELGIEVSIHQLFLNALRMRPDRIIIGEVRGKEAKDVLEVGVTEAGGMLLTVHLKNPSELFMRIQWMLLDGGYTFPVDYVREQVISAFDLVIQIARPADANGQLHRRIVEISELTEDKQIRPIFQWTGADWEQVNAPTDKIQRLFRQYGTLR
ncbi:hypothetical protein TPY_2695 [Sulfobacillus acidophilus TPY]|uniref:Type II secretion system protein E n=1 Tax=Sulfobacillus acidophilus (strain ATCC 700253 / DSM 10332 / NAL) TaxID=679936 RepID=G8TUN7_SULAD|nr:hypothetical protein TPY_2695 [Sulfobacillus acidophilus TPY]AEW04684.1 type II secretion system protein E [Sulfobacillus acidophilus DSM 10332]